MRRRGFGSLAWASAQELFDQTTAFGRLALVHVLMMAGDTLVTVSLAGSLFFSVSPTEAKGRVLAYLLLTIAPFAVVSPLLGPLIDRSANGRRILVALSAVVRAVFCWMMSEHLNSLWLFPMAFVVLISSKLYVVTRGALVPEMARTDQLREHSDHVGGAGWPSTAVQQEKGYSGFNAQLTLLGTLSGLVVGSIGAGILKGVGATSVLVTASVVFIAATVASLRLQRPAKVVRDEVAGLTPGRTRPQRPQSLGRHRGPLGTERGGADALHGRLRDVPPGLRSSTRERRARVLRLRARAQRLRRTRWGWRWSRACETPCPESTLLTLALLATGVGAGFASLHPTLIAQVVLAGWLGLCAAVAQPTFDAITQRHVAPGAQGRTFARFAVRQQLLWVVGAVIPVAITLRFSLGDGLLAVLTIAAGLVYGLGRRFAHS